MVEIVVSERERRLLVRHGDEIFLDAQHRLYDAKVAAQRGRLPVESKDHLTALDRHAVHGLLDDVADLFVNEDKQLVLDFSETREVALLQPSTKHRPLERTSLRWSLFHSPSRHLAKDQDFCYLEVMKSYRTQSGRRGWAKCMHSIEHPSCPEFSGSPGMHVNRGELLYCGVFFEETNEPGVLDATFYYNLNREKIPPVLLPIVLKTRGRRNAELINHFLKTSPTMLYSKRQTLPNALRLQADRCCGVCCNQLSMWKSKDKCVFCGSFICDKCIDIVSRNHRVDGMKRGEFACYSCADRRGSKIMLPPEYFDDDGLYNGNGPSSPHYGNGMLRSFSTSSRGEDGSTPKAFEDKGKPSLLLAKKEPAPDASQFVPYTTFHLPSDKSRPQAQAQRRQTRSSARQPTLERADTGNWQARQRSRTTGNSRLSSRARSTMARPSMVRKEFASCNWIEEDPAEAEDDGFERVGQVGLNLEELNCRMWRHTTNSLPEAKEWLKDTRQSNTTDGTHPSIFGRPVRVSSMRYSKANPCDLSYLSSFK